MLIISRVEATQALAADEALLGSAVSLATADVPVAAPAETVGDVRARLAGAVFTSVADVAVCDGDRLVGLVPLERVLAAAAEAPLAGLMDAAPPVVSPGVDQEVAAWLMVEHGETSLAVVDAGGRFLGLIPPNRMLRVLLQEHHEDLARVSGVLAGTAAVRATSVEPIRRRLWHRLPWLLLGLAGALASAVIVGGFEDAIAERALLAAFLPGVVYMADAVGTQTEALVIRGLSVGVSIRRVLRGELATGGLVGIVVAALFLPFGLAIWGDTEVVVAVALALLAACSTATAVALSLPYALARLGRDPAFGSGPLATVVQDLLSIAIYLAIGTALTG